ncbi:MAG: endospore germination permease [Lysinibacillus sp.]
MGKTVKISILHVIFLCMTVIGLKSHVSILPPILEVGGRDGWLSVILAVLIVLPWLLFLAAITKVMDGRPFIKIVKEKNGPVATMIIKIIAGSLVLLLAAFTMVEMLLWVHSTFLPATPMPILFGVYFILCIALAVQGLQPIVIANVIVLAIVIVLGFFIAFVNIRVKDYSLLLPVLENGIDPVLMAVIFPMAGLTEVLLFIFIQHHVKSRIQFKHFALMLLLLMGLTLGPLVGAIIEFGPEEAAKQRYPAFEEWALASIGEFINHMDFFSIYQWMTGAFIRISFYLYMVTEIFGISAQKKKVWTYVAPPFAFICLVLMLFDEQTYLNMNNYYVLIFSAIVLIILGIIFTFLIRRKKGHRQEGISGANKGDHA